MNLPPGCNTADGNGDGLPDGGPESATAMQLRTQVLNALDGFGTFKTTINITFTEEVDEASLEGRAHLFKIAERGMPVTPEEVAVIAQKNTTVRFDASCANGVPVQQVTFIAVNAAGVPTPLDGASTYVFALSEGVTTVGGQPFEASFVWSLVRSVEDPVTIVDGVIVADRTPLNPADDEDAATLQGIELLWEAHKNPLAALAAAGVPHNTVLVATSFNTQTVTDALDAEVTGTPAAAATATPALLGVARVNPAANGLQFMEAALPGRCSTQGGPLPCEAVGDVLAGGMMAKQFQINTPNPLAGGQLIPGPWADPIKPPEVETEIVQVLITVPVTNICATNCPTVIFGHGLGSNKQTLLAIGAQLASQGFNAVAIDFVAHGSRAVRVSDAAAAGCGGTPDPGTAPQCFAPFLSPNLAATRDNIRQSVIDLHSLNAALKACGTNGCGSLSVDATKIEYMGISLGGIMGSVATATTDFKAAVLNVPGAGWVDILENTQSVPIKCSLVNGLIAAGIVSGTPFNPGPPPTGTCLTDDWKLQSGYRQFSVIGRWVLDPADPINFTRALADKRILIQEVVGDQVVPNIATEQEAANIGLAGATADPAAAAPPNLPPSAAIVPNTSLFVRYPTLPAAPPFPGNTFAHASLLAPANAGADGALGTARLQVDAITFLVLNRN